jgi:hypothetical protein
MTVVGVDIGGMKIKSKSENLILNQGRESKLTVHVSFGYVSRRTRQGDQYEIDQDLRGTN